MSNLSTDAFLVDDRNGGAAANSYCPGSDQCMRIVQRRNAADCDDADVGR